MNCFLLIMALICVTSYLYTIRMLLKSMKETKNSVDKAGKIIALIFWSFNMVGTLYLFFKLYE